MGYRIEWYDGGGKLRTLRSRHFNWLLERKRELEAAGFAVLFLRG